MKGNFHGEKVAGKVESELGVGPGGLQISMVDMQNLTNSTRAGLFIFKTNCVNYVKF